LLHEFSRTELLIGELAMKKLSKSKIAVFGIGGVGSYTVEGLARSGVGKFVLVDDDYVCITNINRQLHATIKTLGRPKVEVMKERILEINPKAEVTTFQKFYLPENSDELISEDYDYIIDAIDTVTGKIGLVVKAKELDIPIISCMGTGNKLNPILFEVSDIYRTSVCPLARVMRKELRKRGIDSLKVIYSKEEPISIVVPDSTGCSMSHKCPKKDTECTVKLRIPGSISFVPSVAGLIIAGEVVKDIVKDS